MSETQQQAELEQNQADSASPNPQTNSEQVSSEATTETTATASQEAPAQDQAASESAPQASSPEYNSNSIKVLRGLEAVRVRPGMYIGDTDDGSGLHHMVFEVVDNAIDEALAGYCSRITVKIHKDQSVSVSDNGRGIPTDIHPEEGVSAAQVIMTVLHAGGKFDSNSYKVSGGLHGVGVSVVNALSDKLTLTIYRKNQVHFQEYHNGDPQKPLEVIGETTRTGTTVRFWPSPKVFATTEFKYEQLATRLRELSFLNSGVYIEILDERDGRKDVFHYEGGLTEFVKYLNSGKPAINQDPFDFNFVDEKTNITVEIALQWTESYKENIHCFTNNIPQKDGGTHLTGFKSSLTRVVTNYAEAEVISKAKRNNDIKIEGDDIREGLTAIISVKVPDPKFSSQTKEKLVSSEVTPVVSKTILEKLSAIFEEQPKLAHSICEKVITAARTRAAARKARDLARETRSHLSNPSKLRHCSNRDPSKSELYLVEGDSAGGSAVQARNTSTQAILPLRGKILNVERARIEKILESSEIVNIISTLKCGIGEEEFNIANLRYHKIVIMTDADVDGSHIRTLLLTFFFRHMPELIEQGHVFIAQPPLYKVEPEKRKPKYLKNDEEYNNFLIEFALNNVSLEVDGKLYQEADIKDLAEKFIKFKSYLKSNHSKLDPDVMETLIYYPELTLEMLDDKASLETWVKGLVDLLKRTHDKSVRFEYAIAENTADDSKYLVQFNVIKHGITESYNIDNFFVNSRTYSDLVELSKEIDQIMPIGGQVSNRFLIRNENKTQVNYFDDFVNALIDYSTTKLKPSRYKGLGEMNAEELENTTMKAEVRTLLKVTIEDAIEADRMFSVLLGDDVEPRRDFINENAIYANIDF